MAGENTQRRLAAILAADVVGYTRLMEADEAGTLTLLKSRRKQVLEPLVARYQGRVFKVMGDGVLVEFASAVNAVQCALDLQAAFAEASLGLADGQRIEIRIGVNLGDVMVEGGDLYGEGVNIASRLEALADPGGILVSASAHEHARKQVKCGFEDLGPQSLKNIVEPVRVHRVVGRQSATAAPATALAPDKPCIAVLPFVNMSGDSEQEYFADGLTEDIITALSRFSGLIVIARTSCFVYKGQNLDTKRVANDLNANYILEGSVRRAGDRVRVTAQLIEGATGHHVWAERFDRPAGDIFDIQDEIMRSVAASTETHVHLSERRQIESRASAEPRAAELVMRAWARIYDFTPEALSEAAGLVEQALRLEPMNPRANIARARVHMNLLWFGAIPHNEANLAASLRFAEVGMRLAPRDEWAHFCLSYAYESTGRHLEAAKASETSIELNPNFSNGYSQYGRSMALLGHPQEAIQACQTALRLNPRDPTYWERHCNMSIAHFASGDYEAAVREVRLTLRANPVLPEGMIMLAAAATALGEVDEAARAVKQLIGRVPGIRPGNISPIYFPGYARAEDQERLLAMLRKAGLPD